MDPLVVAEPADYTAVKPQSVAWVEHKDIKEVGWLAGSAYGDSAA